MKVFKFGGASVKDADSVRNLARIIESHKSEKLIVVVSAMGKMTNAFEWLIHSFCYQSSSTKESLDHIVDFHNTILWDLFPDKKEKVYVAINELFYQLQEVLEKGRDTDYDQTYDSIIGFGELLSTTIVSHFLSKESISNCWLDARSLIKTNSDFRQAMVNWEETEKNIQANLTHSIIVSQGFIGSDKNGNMTSLGREGSDFTAAIFGYCAKAESVTIWKDVEGVLNADPKHFPEASKIDKMSYREAIELSYYGATVIHPKTIKPLENKLIPLYVKSFIHPENEGTVVQKSMEFDALLPSYIFIENQILVSISPKDFSFIAEDNLSFIFAKLAEAKIKVNLIQNSALSFSVCFENSTNNVEHLFSLLKGTFDVRYNDKATLLTIRHYNEEVLTKMTANKTILLEQKSRNSARFVLR
jgi:aspartate kinase